MNLLTTPAKSPIIQLGDVSMGMVPLDNKVSADTLAKWVSGNRFGPVGHKAAITRAEGLQSNPTATFQANLGVTNTEARSKDAHDEAQKAWASFSEA